MTTRYEWPSLIPVFFSVMAVAGSASADSSDYSIERVSASRLRVVSVNSPPLAVRFPCEIAKVVVNPSAPLAAVYCYEKLPRSRRQLWVWNNDGTKSKCDVGKQYQVVVFFLDLKTGQKRSMRSNSGSGSCDEPKPQLSGDEMNRVWSPQGSHVVLHFLPRDPFLITSVNALQRWIAEGVRVWRPVWSFRLTRTEAIENDPPEHVFYGWVSEDTFSFGGLCCGTGSYYSYDYSANVKKRWGSCAFESREQMDQCERDVFTTIREAPLLGQWRTVRATCLAEGELVYTLAKENRLSVSAKTVVRSRAGMCVTEYFAEGIWRVDNGRLQAIAPRGTARRLDGCKQRGEHELTPDEVSMLSVQDARVEVSGDSLLTIGSRTMKWQKMQAKPSKK